MSGNLWNISFPLQQWHVYFSTSNRTVPNRVWKSWLGCLHDRITVSGNHHYQSFCG